MMENKGKSKYNKENKIVIKFLKDDSDFLYHHLSDKNLRELQDMLSSIEKKVPKENTEKLSNLKEKNQDPRLLIETIFESDEDRYKELLISNFENNLMASSRASDKLIIFYQSTNNNFVIIHSKLKKSLYSHSKGHIDYIRIEKCLLDQKDFLRIAFFDNKKSEVYVKIKELSQSKFFDRWLNFKNLRKSYNKALTIEVEFGKEILLYSPDLTEFYNKLQNEEARIEKGRLIFSEEGEDNQNLKISSIEFEDTVYSTQDDFNSFLNNFFLAQRYPELNNLIQNFQNFLDRLKQTLIGWSAPVPSNKIELFENEESVYSLNNEEIIFKKIKLENVDYIICSGQYPNCSIKPDKKFFEIIESKINKSIPLVRFLHLCEKVNIKEPRKINSILLMNDIKMNKSYETLETSLDKLLDSRRDSKLIEILKILKFYIFIEFTESEYIKTFFKSILDKICIEIETGLYIDKELKAFEFKSKKIIEHKSPNEIKSYLMEVAQKYCYINCKFIVIGIEDKDLIDGVEEKYFNSGLIGEIQEELEIFLKVHNKKPFLQHIRIKKNRFLIIFIIY